MKIEAAQWDEEEKLEEILEQRRMEGSSLQLEAKRIVYLSLWCMNACHKEQGCKASKKRRKYPDMVYGRDGGKAEHRCGGRC